MRIISGAIPPEDLSKESPRSGLPWPLSNRDLVVDVIVNADTVNGVYSTKAVHFSGVVPENPDNVRMPNYRQSWTITPAG